MDKTQDTSHSLIEALASGANEEFEAGFRRFCSLYHQVIRRWCQRWFEEVNDADDAAQEILLKLHGKLKGYARKEGIRFRNWLSRVSKNIAIDVIRKKKKYVRDVSTDVAAELEVTDYVGELLIDFERRELIKKVLSNIDENISEKDRMVLKGYLNETPVGQMAVEFNSSENAIYQSMFRIKRSLKELISQQGFEEADFFLS